MADTGGGANVEVFDSIAIREGGTIQRKRKLICPATLGHIGAGTGFLTNNNTGAVQCPASETAATFVIPITGLHHNDIITGFTIMGQLEAAGNTATVDADFRKVTAAAAAVVDSSVGAIVQVSELADYLINDSKTFTTAELVSDSVTVGTIYYVLVTVTTAAVTDIDLMGVQVHLERQ